MVALKTERRVFLWKLYPRPMPLEAGKLVTLAEILTLLTEEFEAKRARAFLSSTNGILTDNDPACDPRHQIYLADLKMSANKKTVTLLFNRGDPNTVSPAFIDSGTSDVRVEHPKSQEAPGWSAHLLIEVKGDAGIHKACFEQMTKVSSSLVIHALDHILTRAALAKNTYFYSVFVGSGKKRKEEARIYRPYLQLDRVPSENLERDLQQGRLSHVTLRRKRRTYAGPGASHVVREEEEILKISTRHTDDDSIVKEFISGVVNYGREREFESISFGLTDLPGDQTKSTRVDLDGSDVLDSLYVRAHRITDFNLPLEGCHSKVCLDIENKMLSLLKDKESWRES